MANDRATRDREMAAHLVKIGYPHGRRFSSGKCVMACGAGFHEGPCRVTGSSKFRRLAVVRSG